MQRERPKAREVPTGCCLRHLHRGGALRRHAEHQSDDSRRAHRDDDHCDHNPDEREARRAARVLHGCTGANPLVLSTVN